MPEGSQQASTRTDGRPLDYGFSSFTHIEAAIYTSTPMKCLNHNLFCSAFPSVDCLYAVRRPLNAAPIVFKRNVLNHKAEVLPVKTASSCWKGSARCDVTRFECGLACSSRSQPPSAPIRSHSTTLNSAGRFSSTLINCPSVEDKDPAKSVGTAL